jgi:hypothetical protein
MDTDKIKIFGARVKVDGTGKLAELERAEKVSSISYSAVFFGIFLLLTLFVPLGVSFIRRIR